MPGQRRAGQLVLHILLSAIVYFRSQHTRKRSFHDRQLINLEIITEVFMISVCVRSCPRSECWRVGANKHECGMYQLPARDLLFAGCFRFLGAVLAVNNEQLLALYLLLPFRSVRNVVTGMHRWPTDSVREAAPLGTGASPCPLK